MFTTRTALVSTATLALIGLTAAPATASPTREGPHSTHRTTIEVAPAATALYADPLEALGGLTLAQYLSDHMARRVHPGV